MRNRKHDGNKSSVVNFGVQGWVTILYCLLMFWLYAGMVNSGSNSHRMHQTHTPRRCK